MKSNVQGESSRSAAATIADLATALLAAEDGRLLAKLRAVDADTERFRARMNAVADRQAGVEGGGASGRGGEMEVLTNSPVTHYADTYNYAGGDSSWWKAAVVGLALLAGGGLAASGLLLWRSGGGTPPAVSSGSIDIEVTPGGK